MKIETKYNIGEHIWVIYEARINNEYCHNMPTGEVSVYDAYIDSISKYKDGLMYFCNDGNYTELHEEDIILYEETDKLVAKIKELKLQGRVIKSFYTVGMGYNWTDDNIGEAIYNTTERMIKENRISSKGPFPFLPEGVYISRYAKIDEPFLIEFEDGDILGVDYSEGSCVRMELNTIPKDIKFGTNRRTFHPNVLFSSLIGRELVAVEVTTSTELDEFTWSHGLDIGEQDAYITKISFVCKKDREWEREKLEFTSWCDYGMVAVTDYEGVTLKIHAPDVREVVAGFIDEETLNLQDDFSFDD